MDENAHLLVRRFSEKESRIDGEYGLSAHMNPGRVRQFRLHFTGQLDQHMSVERERGQQLGDNPAEIPPGRVWKRFHAALPASSGHRSLI